MYNGDLHIEYVCDRDAGAELQDEGEQTDNPMMYLHVAQLPVEYHCGVVLTNQDPPSWTTPPIEVPPGGSRIIRFTLQGIYGLGGVYVVTSNHPGVPIIVNQSGYLNPGETKVVEAMITYGCQEFIDAIITIRSCIGTVDEDSIKLPLYAVCKVVDCSKSKADSCLTFCPLGDIDFKVTLRDNANHPVVGYSNIWLDFTDCAGEVIPCPSFHPQWPKVFPEGPSNESGLVYFRVHAGGYSGHSVKVKTVCGQIAEVFFPKSVDLSGNLLVEPSDFDVSYGNKRDFNCDGTVDWRDDDIFKRHKNHGCYFSPCLLLQQTITLDPDTTLVPGDSIDVKWRLDNLNSFDTCFIQKVELLYTNFSGSVGPFPIATEYWNSNLPPGGNIQLTVRNFKVPDLPNICVIARTYTDCCTLYAEAKNCRDIRRHCPPDSITYRWFMLDIGAPTQIDTTFRGAVPDTWSYSIQWNVPPDTDVVVEITTDDASLMGTEGGVTLWFKYDDIWEDKNFEVIFTLNSGDMNSDCKVSASDVVYLINYLFIHGPSPDPFRAADVNCDCRVNVSDVVYLINYLFIGGPPPVSSEACKCEYEEEFRY
jgi:hypothetical protein